MDIGGGQQKITQKVGSRKQYLLRVKSTPGKTGRLFSQQQLLKQGSEGSNLQDYILTQEPWVHRDTIFSLQQGRIKDLNQETQKATAPQQNLLPDSWSETTQLLKIQLNKKGKIQHHKKNPKKRKKGEHNFLIDEVTYQNPSAIGYIKSIMQSYFRN